MNTPETINARYCGKKREIERLINDEKDSIKQQEQLADKLGRELMKLETLAKQLEESEASSEDLARQIAAKKSEISLAQSAVQKSSARISTHEAAVKALEPALWLVDYCQNILKEESIPIIAVPGELFAQARLRVTTKNGRPEVVEVAFPFENRSEIEYKVPVKDGASRIIKGFMPDELRWLPKGWLHVESPFTIDYQRNACEIGDRNGHAKRESLRRVYYVTGEERLMPVRPKLGWLVKNHNYRERSHHAYYTPGERAEPEWYDQERDIGKDLPSFCQVVEAEIEAAGGSLDLGMNYPKDSFLGFLKSAVMSVSVPVAEQQFEPAGDPLRSEEIAKRLQPYWEKFVSGPWLPDLDGLLANLKYYCESGERPRFYTRGLKESYGFRVRTRDHSWIVGFVFVLPANANDSQATKGELEIEEVGKESSQYLFRVGRMCAYVIGEERLARR